ncbi:protein-L-isoaspartate O-methyltransferase family protein [Angustibacter sp. McL0619]|uniref:protein-L-isoaspartate O-methyltransferase family protein n=1 Tax=Angustibacter sp. McL0619 TaxID=3415676 RepID=UPI003CF7E87B
MHDRATAPEAVDRAFASAPRTGFLPRAQQPHAHEDQPLEIGYGQTSSQPSTVRRMLRLLDVAPGHRVLDVGSGSGWTTALLGYLVGPVGEVVGVELEPDLALWGASNLAAHQLPWTRIQRAEPGRLGWPVGAPFDRVLVSAAANAIPDELVDQLTPDGVMVCPVAGRMARICCAPDGNEVHWYGNYRFVPLR